MRKSIITNMLTVLEIPYQDQLQKKDVFQNNFIWFDYSIDEFEPEKTAYMKMMPNFLFSFVDNEFDAIEIIKNSVNVIMVIAGRFGESFVSKFYEKVPAKSS